MYSVLNQAKCSTPVFDISVDIHFLALDFIMFTYGRRKNVFVQFKLFKRK